MNCIYLSYPLSSDAPRPPAIPAPSVTEFMSVTKDGASVQEITFYNHTGTHLDTAAHVLEEGISIEKFEITDLVFANIAVIEFSLPDRYHITPGELMPYYDKLVQSDMAIFRFNVEMIRKHDSNRFSDMMPGFTCEAAMWLRQNCRKLRCLGTDVPSFAVISDLENTMKAHNIFLEGNDKKMLIIEEMNLTEKVDCYERIIVCPWFISGVNSGPCTILGLFKIWNT